MPERGFDTGFWGDKFVRALEPLGKYLFSYLWTNDHCNQAGVYEIGLDTIAFETGMPESTLPALLESLAPKVKWLPEDNLIWVKNFLAHQAKSPKFLIAAAKCLNKIRNDGLVTEVVEYNLARHSISIPYQYHIDSVSIPPVSVSASVSNSSSKADEEIGVVKGEGERTITGESIPPSESEIEESLSEGDGKVISVWCSVKRFSMPNEEAAELVARLRTEFPDVDILAESKAWAARKLSEPLKPGSRPSSQIWNWMTKAREFAQERRMRDGRREPGGESERLRAHREDARKDGKFSGFHAIESGPDQPDDREED